MRQIDIENLSRYFFYAAIVNLAVAFAITVPVLVPEFTFPLILTNWPGTWMFISYFLFLIVAVLGSLGWAVAMDFVRIHFGSRSVNRYLAEAHFALNYLGIYGATTLMFALGYIGGQAKFIGFANEVITQGLVGWMVVPIGVFAYLYLIGTVLGIANLLLAVTRKTQDFGMPA